MNLQEIEGRRKNIQVKCKTHTLNEYFSMAMYPLNAKLTIKKGTMKSKSKFCTKTKEKYKPHWSIPQLPYKLYSP